MAHRPDGLTPERLLAERGDQLMRAAIALTGSRQEGEDLLQAALERLLRNWHRVQGDAEAYLRRILYNLAASPADPVQPGRGRLAAAGGRVPGWFSPSRVPVATFPGTVHGGDGRR